ncbi:MAG: NAD(P)H-dependent oxidoreductase subunit E [bacterium]
MQKKPIKKKGTSGLESVVNKFEGKAGSLLSILEELQGNDAHNHLSEDTLKQVAQKAGIPMSQVYSVATFYSFFNLKPQGKHTIVVCRGTACHTRGSRALLEESAAKLGFSDFTEDDEASVTTPDNKFTVRTVACFGQCALAPVVALDGIIHSHVTPGKLLGLLEKLQKEERR